MEATAVGAIERAEQVQERALAATTLTDDGQQLAITQRQIDAPQHRHFEIALEVRLVQIATFEQWLSDGHVWVPVQGVTSAAMQSAGAPCGCVTCCSWCACDR